MLGIFKSQVICTSLVLVFLGGCKIQIEVPEGGIVLTESGRIGCNAGEVCTIDVSDLNFDEVFMAEPEDGYRFLGWSKRDRGLCGGKEEPCRLSTKVLTANDVLMAILQSDEIFYLTPVFSCEGEEDNCYAIKVSGEEEIVFDWSKERCDEADIPDLPARAFRDASGSIQVISSHFVSRRMIGPDFKNLQRDCRIIMNSDHNADPGLYNDKEWIAATYTTDGNKIHAIVHNEYQGHTHEGQCPSNDYYSCWYNSLTYAWSDDRGMSYKHVMAPDHLVASVPYKYTADKGPYGIFEGSNIVHNPKDRFYYRLARATAYEEQKLGTIVMRTPSLDDPSSWRCWDGFGFNVSFVNPHKDGGFDPSQHLCEPVSKLNILNMAGSLTYNTFLDKYLLVAHELDYGPDKEGFFFSLSDDLIHWSPRRLIFEANIRTGRTDGGDFLIYPSIIDHKDRSRNFEYSDQDMHLYFTRWYEGSDHDRDLVRVPVKINVGEPTDPLPPQGSLDVVDCSQIAGWTIDFDAQDQPLEVAIYDVDDEGNETLVTISLADVYRPDLESAFGTSGIHGFVIPTPLYFRDGAPHIVQAYGINPDSRFPNGQLTPSNPSAAKSLQCSAN